MIAKIHDNTAAGQTASRKLLISREDYRFVEDGFRMGLPVSADIEWHLRGVMTDTLSHPGSLARAQLSFDLLKGMGMDELLARDVGIVIEYFHTASLLFDDLPCMDNADKRRGHSCPHVVHGESAAILGALGLINQGYALLWKVMHQLPENNRIAAGQLVNECLGVNGILNGQSFDLHFAESGGKESDVLRIAHGKTVTLIRLTLLLPGHLGGAGEADLHLLEKLSVSWGLAYQILDDFKDCLMNTSDTGKTTARDQSLHHPNLPLALGSEEALNILNQQLMDSRKTMLGFGRQLSCSSSLDKLQSLLESERDRVVAMLRMAESLAASTTT